MRYVLEHIKKAGLKLNPEKCKFLQTEVTFWERVVSGDGVRPNPENLIKIKQCPQSKYVTQIRQFLSLACYCIRNVNDFSKIVTLMFQLTKKGDFFLLFHRMLVFLEE